ncbi:hypothetical protein DL767_010076 [Monosporascus sp. MG133]|nr:hypothetical protein DL767_010076 [Monosporascus sp. MG133]
MVAEGALRAMLRDELAAALHISPEELQLEQSFFAQGGDSLSAIHFMSKCRMAGLETDIVDILKAKTLSELITSIVLKHESEAIKIIPNGHLPHSDTASASSHSSYTLVDARLLEVVDDPDRKIESIGPCSSMQNRILISQAVNPAAYQCLFILKAQSRAPGSLTASRITDIWRRVVARHSTLRTTFLESEHRPSTFDQVVWTEVEPNVTILEDESQINQEEMIRFHSTTVPHHLYIYQISPVEVVLRLEISHALVDGQSAGILLQDLNAAYEDRLPTAKPMPYADFVRSEDQDLDGAEDFWGRYLEGAEETYLEGALGNRPKVGLRTFQERVHIPAETSRRFCDRYGVTMVNVCQVAWGMVLRFFALKEDVAFSYVTSGRQTQLPGIHDAVGLFISSLVLRMDFTTNPRILDMLNAAREDVFRSMSYDKVPLLTEKSSKLPTAHKWGNSILSFGKEWQPLSQGKNELDLSVLRRISPTDYDHSLNIEFGEASISVDYDIWTSTTSIPDAEKMLNCFLRGIEFILASPEARVGDFDAISDEDSKRLREENGNGRPAVNRCIHSMLQEVTDRQPDAVALP